MSVVDSIFDVIGNFNTEEAFTDIGNLADNAALGDHFVALIQAFDHLFVFLGLFLLRTNQQEVEDNEKND